MDEAARDVVPSLQGDTAHGQSTVRERLERLAGQCGMQAGSSA